MKSLSQTLLSLCSALCVSVIPITTHAATSDPVGAMTVTVPAHDGSGSTVALLGVSFLKAPLFAGAFDGVTASTLSDSAATWVADDYGANGPDGDSLFYVELQSGTYEGLMIPITGNTSDTLSFSDDVSFVDVGTQYSIRAYHTLRDLFGASNELYALQGAGSVSSADAIYLINNAGEFERFFYQEAPPFAGGNGWRKVGDTSTNYADKAIPTGAFLVSRNGSTPRSSLDITFYGSVKLGKQTTPVYEGNNLVANSYPLDFTLETSGLFESNILSGGSVSQSDVVYVLNDSGLFERYFYQTAPPFAGGTGWRKAGDVSTDQGSLALPAGSSFIVWREGAGGIDWTQNQPF